VPLEHVDPRRRRGVASRLYLAVARTPPARWLGIHVASRVDASLMRRTGGRVRLSGPAPTALLTTRGARSGRLRQTPVLYFHDDGDVVLIASSFGRDRHPSWYHNLLAHPTEARLDGEPYSAAEVTDPAEAERLFGLAVQVYPGYADYRERTGRVGRRIPVLRLTPRA
jgi:deazaflavin-dependent oxidoreductase (nitroreductase family)